MNAVDSFDLNREVTLSLITPCLNCVATIEDTLLSVARLNAQFRLQGWGLEHVIVDGGSSDGTLTLIKEHQRRMPACSLIPSVVGGPYPAMNVGLINARGVYSHILNADDMIWDVDAYVALVRNSLQQGAQFMMGSIAYFGRPNKQISAFWRVEPLPKDRQQWKMRLRAGLHYPHPGFICRTDLYRSLGFDEKYTLSADYKLMQSLLLSADVSAPICTTSNPIVAMDQGGMTGQWHSIYLGRSQLRQINQELGIHEPVWRRYARKIASRCLGSWL